MLNRIIKDHFKIPDSLITIEYQVTEINMLYEL